MSCCLSQADGAEIFAAFCVGQENDFPIKEAEHIDPFLSVGFPVVFNTDDRMIEDRVGTSKIQTVFSEIGSPLVFVVGNHDDLIVAAFYRKVN